MANFLTTFSQREILTASKLNDVVNLVNDHERRLLAQKITSGTGYTFTQSQGGTSLQITPKGSEEGDGSSSSTPFRVSLIKGNFDGFNYAVSATSGTIFGTSGTSSSYDYIDASDDDHDNEANCKLYTYVNLSEGEWLVHAVLYVEATTWGLMNNYGGGSGDGDGDGDGGDGDDISALAGIVSTCIPFRCEFQWIDAERLDEWRADARGEIGWKIVGGEALDDYGLGYTYEVHFPIAIVTMKSGNSGLSASITQLLHSDIFWNGHKTFSA